MVMKVRVWLAAGVIAMLGGLLIVPGAAAVDGPDPGDPFEASAGVFKLGGNSLGIPYTTPEGTVGVLTARHGVGDDPATAWRVTDADGRITSASIVPGYSSATADTVLMAPNGFSFPPHPEVRLSDDYTARFQSAAKSRDDVQVGDRVCSSGWSPLNRAADGQGVANVIEVPDIPGRGQGVICGRVYAVGNTLIWVEASDRPDGLLNAVGNSGGALWKPTEDGAFMFLGMVYAGQTNDSTPVVGGAKTYTTLFAKPAWHIASTLGITPATDPALARPYITISPSTYYPTRGGTVTLSGRFVDDSGDPLAERDVEVVVNESESVLGTVNTDATGRFTYAVQPSRHGTDYAFRFAGDEQLAPVTSRSITLSPTVVTIAEPVTVASGQAVTIRARAASASGVPMAGRTVRLQLYPLDANTYTIGATATTDAQGYVDLTIPPQGEDVRYAARLMADPSPNGNPVGAAASAIYRLGS